MLGAGPSILTVLLLTHLAGLDIDHAIGTSLAVVTLMSLVALAQYVGEGQVVWKPAVCFGLASMTSAFLAGRVASVVPETVLLVLFLLSMMVAAIVMLVRRPLRELGPMRKGGSAALVLAGSGLLIGTLTGLIGLGGGFAVVPVLVVFARTPVRSAIGASLVVIAANTLAGLGGHLPHPPVNWRIAAYLGGAEAMGSVLGVRLSRHMSSTALRHAFAVIMLGAALFLLAHTFLRPHARTARGPWRAQTS
jgi:uncharacterized membrane protein YfcA